MKSLYKILTACVLLSIPVLGNSAIITQSHNIATSTTDISEQFELFRFNDQNGTLKLDEVNLTFTSFVNSIASAESLDNKSSKIVSYFDTQTSLNSNILAPLVVDVPRIKKTFKATSFDGLTDFSGTSGTVFQPVYANQLLRRSYTNQDILDLFTGTDLIKFTFGVTAVSRITGSGNITSSVDTTANGNVTLEYVSTPIISVPATMGFMGMFGILGLLLLRKKDDWPSVRKSEFTGP